MGNGQSAEEAEATFQKTMKAVHERDEKYETKWEVARDAHELNKSSVELRTKRDIAHREHADARKRAINDKARAETRRDKAIARATKAAGLAPAAAAADAGLAPAQGPLRF